MDYRYTPAHFWIAPEPANRWRVGLTKFAVRMLGEMVDHGFEVPPEAEVLVGQIIGFVEGFKAISDLYCIVSGKFIEGNPTLKEKIATVHRDPYGAGWLYRVEGEPDANCVDVDGYVRILDRAIDKILEQQKQAQIE